MLIVHRMETTDEEEGQGQGQVARGRQGPAPVDPWRITGPTVLSVSGGRTSMKMLWHYLDRYDGVLPAEAVAVFTNTGREHPKTLDFVQRCSVEWSVPIIWLEYQDAEKPADRWRAVNHNSASRNGEPFAAVIKRRKFLPNQVSRFCTEELKVLTLHRWWQATHSALRYTKAIGFRADEGHRVAKAQIRCGARKDPWDLCWPLYEAGITKPDVLDWWAQQPFDLGLPERLGNCDLCFLKARWKLAENIEDEPAVADWWIEQERLIGGFFRPRGRNYASYEALRRLALGDRPKPWKQGDLLGLDLLDIECACTD